MNVVLSSSLADNSGAAILFHMDEDLKRMFVKVSGADKWRLLEHAAKARVESLEEYAGILLVEAMDIPQAITNATKTAAKRKAGKVDKPAKPRDRAKK